MSCITAVMANRKRSLVGNRDLPAIFSEEHFQEREQSDLIAP
jgi:hypothetical protein